MAVKIPDGASAEVSETRRLLEQASGRRRMVVVREPIGPWTWSFCSKWGDLCAVGEPKPALDREECALVFAREAGAFAVRATIDTQHLQVSVSATVPGFVKDLGELDQEHWARFEERPFPRQGEVLSVATAAAYTWKEAVAGDRAALAAAERLLLQPLTAFGSVLSTANWSQLQAAVDTPAPNGWIALGAYLIRSGAYQRRINSLLAEWTRRRVSPGDYAFWIELGAVQSY